MRGCNALAFFRELATYSVFHEQDVIHLSTEQMCGLAAIHDVTQCPVTFGDVIPSDRPLAVLRCCWNSGSRESTGALLSCTKQPSDYPIDSLRSVWSVLTALLALFYQLTSYPVFVSVVSSICERSSCVDDSPCQSSP